MKEQDVKTQVISRLLEMARLIRRRGTPDEAEVAVVYERQLEHDLEERNKELTSQRELALPRVKSDEEVHV